MISGRFLALASAMLTACAACFVTPAAALTIFVSGGAPAQGTPLLVEVAETGPVDNMALTWRGAPCPLRETAPGRYEALIGVDLMDAAGPGILAAESVAGGVRNRVEMPLSVVERDFPVQKMTLPAGMAEFDAPTLRRIGEEKKALDERFARVTVPILWTLPFLAPVEEFRPENFGSRRVINGEPRAPHTGVDIRLPEGTPVRAIAGGVVVLAAEQFFGGKSVVIDHGGAVFSLYYHLQRYSVEEGRRVARGETIGAVGATGRATGPHLHFGVRVPGGRVDPSLLFALPGKETAK